MAARSIWNGSISFGLVNVPVKLYSAVGEKTVRFNQIDSKTGTRIRQKRVNGKGDEVAFEDIVKGYELAPDRYVTFTEDELTAIAPTSSRVIPLEKFVEVSEIDPMIYDACYYAGPTVGGEKSFRLLLDAMRASSRAGIGKVILRSKEKLCVVYPGHGESLVVSTMVYADEVKDTPEVAPADYQDREFAMAKMLIESLTETFDHAEYRDEYRGQLMAQIEAKGAGVELEVAEENADKVPAPDLMAALEASLMAVPKKNPVKKQTARKTKVTS